MHTCIHTLTCSLHSKNSEESQSNSNDVFLWGEIMGGTLTFILYSSVDYVNFIIRNNKDTENCCMLLSARHSIRPF